MELGFRIPRAVFQIPKPRIPDSNYNKMTRQLWHIPCPVVSKWTMWNDNEYEIFLILGIAHAWTSVILGGKRDSRRHSTTSFNENVVVAGTRSQMLEVLAFCNSGEVLTSFNNDNSANFSGWQKVRWRIPDYYRFLVNIWSVYVKAA